MTLYAYAGQDKLVILEISLKIKNLKQDSVHISTGEIIRIIDDQNKDNVMQVQSATDISLKRRDVAVLFQEQDVPTV